MYTDGSALGNPGPGGYGVVLMSGPYRKELSCGYDFTFGKGGAGTTETLCRVAERHGVKVNVVEPVTLDGEPVSLTPLEYSILKLLMSHPGQVFTREQLLEQVWEFDGFLGDLRVVDVMVRRLREKA